MTFLQQKFLVLDDEQRPTDPAGVRVDPDLAVLDVAHHRHLAADGATRGRDPISPVFDSTAVSLDKGLLDWG